MWAGCRGIWSLLIGLFRSRATLEAENLVLRQQILVLRRTAPKRLNFDALDRLISKKPSGIAAWPRQTVDKACADRIYGFIFGLETP
jgi:hypothetical protein